MTHISTHFRAIRAFSVPLAASVLFIVLGSIFIPCAGVQNDEALFAAPLYEVNSKDFCFTAFHRQIPIMVMSYVGTLKTLLYAPILAIFGSSVWTVRLPMVLLGSVTIFIFYHLAKRSAPRTAWLAAFLLATDPSFLLTNTFDWGPVALELFLLVTACLFLVRFADHFVSMRDLFFGFFCLGLALWNKALFSWALVGLVCAGIAVFWPEIRKALRFRFAAVASAAFLLGVLPFVIYNIRHRNATFGSNAKWETINVALKLPMERATLNGSGLFGYLTTHDWDEHPKATLSVRGRVALWIRAHLGGHRQNGLEYAFLLALLAVPWWWRSRAARFSLIFILAAWTVMALTRDAGDSVHHCVLIWPFPHLFIAATFTRARWASVAATVLIAMNLLVLNQYVLDFERDGAGANFTDALFPLSKALRDPRDNVEEPIYVMDWGMLNTLALLHQGRLLLRPADGRFSADIPSELDQRIISIMFSDPNAVYVGHVPSREVTPGVGKRLERAAAASGLRKELVRSIADSNGRPVFEVFRLVKLP